MMETQIREAEIFPWNSNFAIGVEVIDDQHKNLVRLINEICSCALNDQDHREMLESLFQELVDYTVYHFNFEENFYQENKLPAALLKKHISNHSSLVEKVLFLKKQYDVATDKNAGLDEILTTLVLWLTNHILREDTRMCMIMSSLEQGISEDAVEDYVDRELDGAKGAITKIMVSMTNVSSASFKELRREIAYRREIEEQLKEEIRVRKEAEEKLRHLALHDALTQLPNRKLFEELCSGSLRTASRDKSEQAVLFIDIDGFKEINDTLGHDAGDSLLVEVAGRLTDSLRESDVVARFGGDEFVIHLGGKCSKESAMSIALKIVKLIAQPFEFEQGAANIGASVGISLFPSDSKDTRSLVKQADEAMYIAKKSGKNSARLFEEITLN